MDDEARAAIVQNGSVTNVVIVTVDADGATEFVVPDAEVIVVTDVNPVSPGWSYENGNFVPPEPTEE